MIPDLTQTAQPLTCQLGVVIPSSESHFNKSIKTHELVLSNPPEETEGTQGQALRACVPVLLTPRSPQPLPASLQASKEHPPPKGDLLL